MEFGSLLSNVQCLTNIFGTGVPCSVIFNGDDVIINNLDKLLNEYEKED